MTIPRWFGFNAPFFDGAQNVLSRQADSRLLKNDLLQLLLTAVGERVMRPTFGTIIRPSLFEPLTNSILTSIEQDIRDKVAQFDRRVNLSDVQVSSDEDNSTITVKVFGSLDIDRFNREPASISSDIDLLLEIQLPVSEAPVVR